jgi:hypothetical protein
MDRAWAGEKRLPDQEASKTRAEDEIRTRDPYLGKVVFYR